MRTDILERKEKVLEWINDNQSKSFMCRELKCKPETLNSYLVKMEIDYSGNQGGKRMKSDKKRMTALEYSKTHGCRSAILKKKLVEEGYVEDVCVDCKVGKEWNGKPIVLELDHIDGDRFNNIFDNLRILCPNCHSQTPTFRGRGKKGNKKTYNCKDCDNEILKESTRCNKCSKEYRFKK